MCVYRTGSQTERDRAIAEWESVHKYGAGWKPLTGGFASDGKAYVLLYNGEKIMPYSVQHDADKHYFVTCADAVLYVQERGWETPEDMRPCEN